MLKYLFVYGTLKRGGGLHHNLEAMKAEYVVDAYVHGKLYNLGWYPGLRHADDSAVHGEVYRLANPKQDLERLDHVEGVQWGLYRRDVALAHLDAARPFGDVWVYILGREPVSAQLIQGGVWQVQPAIRPWAQGGGK